MSTTHIDVETTTPPQEPTPGDDPSKPSPAPGEDAPPAQDEPAE